MAGGSEVMPLAVDVRPIRRFLGSSAGSEGASAGVLVIFEMVDGSAGIRYLNQADIAEKVKFVNDGEERVVFEKRHGFLGDKWDLKEVLLRR